MSKTFEGYEEKMHILAKHIPAMIKDNGNVKQFSCQG
jgi:hypothetical protein